ncbi:MAG: hypothetical protein Tsb0021_14590 [Chlamydiales bacterium]
MSEIHLQYVYPVKIPQEYSQDTKKARVYSSFQDPSDLGIEILASGYPFELIKEVADRILSENPNKEEIIQQKLDAADNFSQHLHEGKEDKLKDLAKMFFSDRVSTSELKRHILDYYDIGGDIEVIYSVAADLLQEQAASHERQADMIEKMIIAAEAKAMNQEERVTQSALETLGLDSKKYLNKTIEQASPEILKIAAEKGDILFLSRWLDVKMDQEDSDFLSTLAFLLKDPQQKTLRSFLTILNQTVSSENKREFSRSKIELLSSHLKDFLHLPDLNGDVFSSPKSDS